MKRIVLCVFSIILFFLIFCTALAPSVEREMRTLVEVKHIYAQLKMYNHAVPLMALSWRDGANIYQVVEGKGWNTGDRIEEVPQMSYYLVNSLNFITGEETLHGAEIYPGKNFDIVLSASRQPVVGDRISVVQEFREREDIYIVCYPHGAANEDGYTNFFTKTAQSSNAQLLTPMKAEAPYFEQRILYALRGMEAKDLRVYSVADIRQFYEMFPLVFLLALCLLLGVFLWSYSCVLAKKGDRPGLIWRNAGICAGLLGITPVVASRIDLPASLLPEDSILNFSHYRSQFRQIYTALASMGSDLLQQEHSRCTWLCAGMLAAGVLLMVFLVFVDRRKKTK